jgi:hypothetical protein
VIALLVFLVRVLINSFSDAEGGRGRVVEEYSMKSMDFVQSRIDFPWPPEDEGTPRFLACLDTRYFD